MFLPIRASVRMRLFASVVAASAMATSATAVALGSVPFTRDGPFETCVDELFEAWVQAQAELMVNEDPRASKIDDASVAGWTIATMQECRGRTPSVHPFSEEIFGRFMARWREHIFELATSIRQRGQSD